MIHVDCPDCSKSYDVVDELAGKAAKCKACGGRIPIPALRSETVADVDRPVVARSTASAPKTQPSLPSKLAAPKAAAPKSETSAPAKSKVTAKPKPETKQQLDDNDFDDDVEDYDDVEEVEESDEPEEYSSSARSRSSKSRTLGKKHGKKASRAKSSNGQNWFAAFGRVLKANVTILSLVIFGLGFMAFCWKVNADGQNMREVAVLVFFGGIAVLVVANFWLLIKIWRINSGWGVFFLASGALIRGLGKVAPQELIVGLDVLRLLALLFFVIENWSEVKTPVAVFFMGLCMSAVPLLGLGGMARGPVANNPAPVPAVNGAVVNQPVAPLADMRPFPVASVPIPTLPEFSLGGGGRGETFQVPGITCMRQFFTNGKGNSERSTNTPGMIMALNYFEPKGTHAPRSLPCVLIASAGSNLLQGTECPSKEYVSEIVPYVQAGFAVLGFSLDGSSKLPGLSDEQQLRISFAQFQKAQAGMVNVRNAVEFASQKIPQVDPERLFIAGHSSAATLVLLAAVHEPRLKGTVAYAPITDVEARLREALNAPGVDRALPGVRQFAKQSSPLTHATRVSCPVFLFHAADDSNAPVGDSRKFADLLKAKGKRVEFVEVPTGNHYDSMIQQGIPRAIPWLKQLAGMSGSNSVPVASAENSSPISNPAVPKGAEQPRFPPFNRPGAENLGLHPSGRAVTFRFQSFDGKGDAKAAARQSLQAIAWADKNDIEIDSANGEIRIGQLGGSVSTADAHQALGNAGFKMLPGVSIGAKPSPAAKNSPPLTAATNEAPKNDPPKTATATLDDIPAVPTKPMPKTEPTKPKSATASTTSNPPDKKPARETARRVAIFRYDRFTGKGSSNNAMRDALKRFDWADQGDIVLDAPKKEIRIGLLAEPPDFEPARKALTAQGFLMTGNVTTSTTKD